MLSTCLNPEMEDTAESYMEHFENHNVIKYTYDQIYLSCFQWLCEEHRYG